MTFEQTTIKPTSIPKPTSTFIIVIVMFVFFVEVECGLPFYFKHKSFQKVMDYPPFEHVDWDCGPPISCQSFDLHISLAMSVSIKKIVSSMEKVIVALRHMQQKNHYICESITHLQWN